MAAQPDLGAALVGLARDAIREAFAGTSQAPSAVPALRAEGATFVTLRRAGDLRGCIGTVNAWRPLEDDVRANAVAAAFHDPRFEPLSRSEFADTSIEVSLLGPREAIVAVDEDAVLGQLRPGVDGVVLECGRRRATFLPQVWEQLPDSRTFLSALKQKAGLAADFWSPEIRVSRYEVEKFVDEEVRLTP